MHVATEDVLIKRYETVAYSGRREGEDLDSSVVKVKIDFFAGRAIMMWDMKDNLVLYM